MTHPARPLDWDLLRVFLTVVAAGSFTAAARELKLSQSAVSRQICALEDALKAPLFHRHARGLRLTEHADTLVEEVKGMEGLLVHALSEIAASRSAAEGPLRVTTTVTFGSAWLTPRIALFHRLYPEIDITVRLVDAPELDLLSRQADVAVRFEEQKASNLIQRKLMDIRYRLYASRDYMARRGMPRVLSDLDRHDVIVYGNGTQAPLKDFDWILHVGRRPGDERRPALRVNDVYGMFRAVKSGLGIAALPDYVVDGATGLVEILQNVPGLAFAAYLVYAEDQRGLRRVQVFRDFLIQQAREESLAPAFVPPPSIASSESVAIAD